MSYIELLNSSSSSISLVENKSSKLRDERPKRSVIELLKIGVIYLGIELLFSLEIALTVPILLESKVSENIYSYVYFISPLLGFLFQPVLGEMSDRCESHYGRRRPFIFVLALSSFVGIALILNGRYIGERMGDSINSLPLIGVSLTTLGVTLLDFSADSCDSPLRAYLLDTCNYNDQHLALNLHAFVGGIGGALGYILSAIDWKKVPALNALGDEYQVLFVIVTFIFFTCLTITLSSAKEEKFVPKKRESITLENPGDESLDILESSNDSYMKVLFKSYFRMPTELNRLYICETLGWLAFYSTTLFFTDFVAHVVYNGDPSKPKDSLEYYMYEHGIKMGSWCLLIYSISSAVSAIVIENFLIEKYSTKFLFSFNFLFYTICCLAIYHLQSFYCILPFVTSFGIMLTTLTTLPYNLISEFHQDPTYGYQSGGVKMGRRRGIGVDCSLLCSCHFLSQVLVSTFMSYLTSHFGNKVILLTGAAFSILGFFFVQFFVIFPKKSKALIK